MKKPTSVEIVKGYKAILSTQLSHTKYGLSMALMDDKIRAWKPEDDYLPRLEVTPENMQEGELYLLEFKCGELVVVKKETNASEGTHLRIPSGTWYPFYGQMNKALYGPIHLQGEEE